MNTVFAALARLTIHTLVWLGVVSLAVFSASVIDYEHMPPVAVGVFVFFAYPVVVFVLGLVSSSRHPRSAPSRRLLPALAPGDDPSSPLGSYYAGMSPPIRSQGHHPLLIDDYCQDVPSADDTSLYYSQR